MVSTAFFISNAMRIAEMAPFSVSDLIFREDEPVIIKGSGNIQTPEPEYKVSRSDLADFLHAVSPDYSNIIDEFGSIEAAYEATMENITMSRRGGDGSDKESSSTIRLRATGIRCNGGKSLSVVVRITSPAPWEVERLKLPEVADAAIRSLSRGGLLLISGPMSAGKSTTMYAAVNLLNKLIPQSIATIEDPIETLLPSGKGLIIQREVSPYGNAAFAERRSNSSQELADGITMSTRNMSTGDVPDFISGVKGAMRLSISGMMIMEIRDSETANAAIRAAEAGLWVIAGVHASDAVGAIERIINFAPAEERLDRSKLLQKRLHAVIYQTLIPNTKRLTNTLAVEVIYPKALSIKDADRAAYDAAFGSNNFDGVTKKLRENETSTESSPDIVSLNRSLLGLIKAGEVTKEDAQAASYDARTLRTLMLVDNLRATERYKLLEKK
jgi:Tfp pilus assembly pilus retraction ATPase PilT